jgi:diaminopimelate epimerase
MTIGAKPFIKMHGLGNDFAVIDARVADFNPTTAFLRAAADRRRGIGCDQIVVLRPPRTTEGSLYMAIYNGDGSEAGACGNATRCIASLLFNETGDHECVVETLSGALRCDRLAGGYISVDFGPPRLEWDQIPLSAPMDTLAVPMSSRELASACCVSMGNPHAVFFVPDAQAIDLVHMGPRLEHDRIFPHRCNIEVAQILSPDRIRMRVWERGAGITEACGSGACATLVAAVRRGLAQRKATIVLDGGELDIVWREEDGHVVMTGPAALSYRGELPPDFGQDRV